MGKTENEHADAMQNQPTSYLKQLLKLQQDMQKAGNLDGWQAANHEIERFKTEQTMPDGDDPALLEGIKSLRAAYKSATAKLELEKSKKIVAVTKQYVDQLNALQTNLTKAGKVDDAIEVNTEIKNVKSDAKVTSSEFAVAAAEQQTEKKPQPTESPAPTTPTTPDQPKKSSSEPTGKVTESGGAKIYEGQAFPDTAGQIFKNVTIMPTDRTASGQKISATATIYTQDDMEKTASHYYYRTTKMKQGSMNYTVRISLKSANKAYALDNPKLVVEYFGKPVGDSGKVDPKKLDTKEFSIPKIDGIRAVNVELPAFAVDSSSYKSVSRYYGGEYSGFGNDFYGFIASIFDSSGTLVFQTASNNGLKKMGVEKLP